MTREYPKPDVSVDVVPLVIHDGRLRVLLAEREREPSKGSLALIGGYIHTDTDASAGDAARRVLRDKAGITQLYVEQLSTFSGPNRDPRGWSMSVAYFSLSPYERIEGALLQGHLHLVAVEDARGLPFDHDVIVDAAIRRVRGKGAYSDLPARLLGQEFTLRELHNAYQIALDERIDLNAFRRKALERAFLERTEGKRFDEDATRPSSLYRLRPGYAVFERRV
jgi:8-oxo-dGTP diphosphatase